MTIPSQGEPPSSIVAVLQGFVEVSGAGWAMLLQLLRFGSSYGALAGLTSRVRRPASSARSQSQSPAYARGCCRLHFTSLRRGGCCLRILTMLICYFGTLKDLRGYASKLSKSSETC